MYWLYILRCCDDSLYTGISNRLGKRLCQHEEGTGAKYTRGRSPLTLVYAQKVGDRSQASKEEARIKALSRPQKLELIAQNPPKREDLPEDLPPDFL